MSKNQNLLSMNMNALRLRHRFVGRREYLRFFQQNLRLPPDDDQRSFIINVWGNGGVGKTWLLHQFRKQAHDAGTITAFVNRINDIPEVMEQIADQIAAQGLPLKSFSRQCQIYRQKRHELEADPNAPPDLAGYLTKLALGTGLRILRLGGGTGPYGPVLDWVEDSAVIEQASQWASYLSRRLTSRNEKYLLLDPIRFLTTKFLADLNSVASRQPVVLFFDNYGEQYGQELDQWLRDLLQIKYGPVSLHIMVVIAGRQELDRILWSDFEELLARLPLDVFTEEEADEYMQTKKITDEAVKNAILRASLRLPVLLAMLTAVLPVSPQMVGDPSDTAVDLFLRNIPDTKQRSAVLDCALPRQINRDVIAVLVGELEAEAIWNWLRKMPFVEDSPSYRYHPVVRELMLRHKKRVSPKEWDTLHERLEIYYRNQRDKLGLDQQMGLLNEQWRNASLEAYYHRWCQSSHWSVAAELDWFLSELRERSKAAPRLSVTQMWASVMRQAGHDSGMTELEEWGELLYTGLRAYEGGPFEVAVELFTKLLHQPFVDQKWRPFILARRGNAYRRLREYENSLQDLDAAIALAPDLVWAISGRAMTYLRLDQKEKALEEFNRALELEPDFAPDLSRRGWLLAEMGHFEQATADLKRSLELAPDWYVVIRNVTHGFRVMKRYDEALDCINAYLRGHSKDPDAYELRSQVFRDLGDEEMAVRDLERAMELKRMESQGSNLIEPSRGEYTEHREYYRELYMDYMEYRDRW